MDSGRKTVLAPCMGVGKIVAAVTRRAAYLIKEQCPDDVELLSIPALLAGDPHEQELLREHPTVIIDGCALRCAAHIFRHMGVEAAAKIEVNQVMKEHKIGPGRTRKELEESGRKLSNFTADRVLAALQDEGLDAQFSPQLETPSADVLASCACPHAPQDAARASAANNASPANVEGKHTVHSVSVMPCQGIKRTGGRITQRAAYQVVEDRFLGKSQVVCISALAAGVQEDIDMVERFPTVAVNGCGLNCATKAASHYGRPAVSSINLYDVSPNFDGEAHCLEVDLTSTELEQSQLLSDAVAADVERLLGSEIGWQPGPVDLHGLVAEPAKINALTGYADNGQGILVQLAKRQLAAGDASLRNAPAAPSLPAQTPAALRSAEAEVAAAQAVCQNDFPGLQKVASNLFGKPRVNKNPAGASE
jgi:uncharacterized metal-binding protein